MSEQVLKVDVVDLAKEAGAPVSVKKFGDREMEDVSWSRETELLALNKLRSMAEDGAKIQLIGHLEKYAMCAACYMLSETGISTFIPRMEMDVPLKPFSIGEVNTDISNFDITHRGNDDIYINFTFKDMLPGEMYQIIAPALPAGKNIYIKAVGHPQLQSVCLALTYANDCKSIWVSPSEETDTFFCAISNTDEFSFGDSHTVVL